MPPKCSISLLLAAALLAGCPPRPPLLEREAKAPQAPDIACVGERLKEVTDGAVTYEETSYEFGIIHSIGYVLSERHYGFVVTIWNNGSAKIHHGTWIADISAEELKAARAMLRQTEWRLRDKCGLGAVMDNAKERCTGKSCALAA
jgi:hypothetical protein